MKHITQEVFMVPNRYRFETYKKQLFYALLFTFLWGLVAHGYCFAHSSFSHDSLTEFNATYYNNVLGHTSNNWKIQLGRFGTPIYRNLFRANLAIPWAVGMRGLLWIGLSVFCVTQLFDVKSKGMTFLIAGILTCNLTVSATAATYITDFETNMCALFCGAAAAFCWRKVPWGFLIGAAFVAAELSLYQSFLSVVIVLILFVCILDLLDGVSFRPVFLQGLKAIGMILLGGVLYYLAMQLILVLSGVVLASNTYNSLDLASGLSSANLGTLITDAYVTCADYLLHSPFPYPSPVLGIITCISGAAILLGIVCGIRRHHLGWQEILLLLLLTALLGLGMNITYILTMGMVHDLMVYAVWLFYLLALLAAQRLVSLCGGKAAWVRIAVSLAVCVFLYGNVQTANGLYLKKEMEEKSTLSFMTRILYRMEACEGYISGETPVVFVGTTDQLQQEMANFQDYTDVVGNLSSKSLYTASAYQTEAYFHTVLNSTAKIADSDLWYAMYTHPAVVQMPCYPATGSVAMVEDVLVVKLGNDSLS